MKLDLKVEFSKDDITDLVVKHLRERHPNLANIESKDIKWKFSKTEQDDACFDSITIIINRTSTVN